MIIAIEKNNVVYLATDTATKIKNIKYELISESNLQIHKMPSDILIATSGKIAETQRLWLHDEWFKLQKNDDLDKKFLVKKVVPKLYKELDGMNLDEDERSYVKCSSSNAFIAKDSKLYLLMDDFSVTKIKGYCVLADESGMNVMASAYIEQNFDKDAKELIKGCFEYVARHDGEIGNEIIMINTSDLIFERMVIGE